MRRAFSCCAESIGEQRRIVSATLDLRMANSDDSPGKAGDFEEGGTTLRTAWPACCGYAWTVPHSVTIQVRANTNATRPAPRRAPDEPESPLHCVRPGSYLSWRWLVEVIDYRSAVVRPAEATCRHAKIRFFGRGGAIFVQCGLPAGTRFTKPDMYVAGIPAIMPLNLRQLCRWSGSIAVKWRSEGCKRTCAWSYLPLNIRRTIAGTAQEEGGPRPAYRNSVIFRVRVSPFAWSR